jgi:hypothetical protein
MVLARSLRPPRACPPDLDANLDGDKIDTVTRCLGELDRRAAARRACPDRLAAALAFAELIVPEGERRTRARASNARGARGDVAAVLVDRLNRPANRCRTAVDGEVIGLVMRAPLAAAVMPPRAAFPRYTRLTRAAA